MEGLRLIHQFSDFTSLGAMVQYVSTPSRHSCTAEHLECLGSTNSDWSAPLRLTTISFLGCVISTDNLKPA